MTAQTIAWIGIAALGSLTVALECLRRYLVRRNRPLTATEWLERMRKLDTVRPMASRIEGKPGVAFVEKLDLDAELREMVRENGGSG